MELMSRLRHQCKLGKLWSCEHDLEQPKPLFLWAHSRLDVVHVTTEHCNDG